ncbi:hypothetical protein SUGI_0833410 [Cryptomeria japonica]|nr:hypothetical protein SUGI_0833410 [Cryptomeria japonica]
MFRGQENNVEGKHRLRGDINCLLLGDLRTTKFQFLKMLLIRSEKRCVKDLLLTTMPTPNQKALKWRRHPRDFLKMICHLWEMFPI